MDVYIAPDPQARRFNRLYTLACLPEWYRSKAINKHPINGRERFQGIEIEVHDCLLGNKEIDDVSPEARRYHNWIVEHIATVRSR